MYQKLVGCAHIDESRNPYGYIALVHYNNGISRPVKQHELQEIVSTYVMMMKKLKTLCMSVQYQYVRVLSDLYFLFIAVNT